jgi:hypothetical protein
LVLQSCIDSLQLPGSSNETFPSSPGGTCHVGNIKVEEDIDMQEEVEEEEVNVKTENVFGSEEVEGTDIKDEDGIYSEEEEEEDIDTKEDRDLDVIEEVSCEDKL